MSHRWIIVLAAAATAGSVLIIVLLLSDLFHDGDRPSVETIAAGRTVYQGNCTRCHGANLEGQSDWQSPLPSGGLPAPPHDASGHTWHHSDRLLFEITKHGTAAVVGGGYESDMPGFAQLLSDDEIRAALAFIKSTWPVRERRYQEEITRRDAERRATGEWK